MLDKDWITNLAPDEAEAALKSIIQSMEGPLSVKEATELHRVQKLLKANLGAGSLMLPTLSTGAAEMVTAAAPAADSPWWGCLVIGTLAL